MYGRRSATIGLVALALTACTEEWEDPTGPRAAEGVEQAAPAGSSMAAAILAPNLPALDPRSAHAYMMPLGPGIGDPDEFDGSLLDVLRIEVCELFKSKCVRTLRAFGNDAFGSALGSTAKATIRNTGMVYHADWKIDPAELVDGKRYGIRTSVAGLEIGAVDLLKVPGRLYVEETGVGVGEKGMVMIGSFIENHPVIRVRALHARGASASDIARQLVAEFGTTLDQTRALLAGDAAPFGAAELARAYHDVHGVDVDVAGSSLLADGLAPVDVAQALVTVFAAAATDLARIWYDAGRSAQEAADVIDAALPILPGELLKNLYDENYPLLILFYIVGSWEVWAWEEYVDWWYANVHSKEDETRAIRAVMRALTEAFAVSHSEIAGALRDVGIAADDIARGARDEFGIAYGEIASMLANAGFSPDEIAQTLRDEFGLSSVDVGAALRIAGHGAQTIGEALRGAYTWMNDLQLAITLKTIGYGSETITGVLEHVFDTTPARAAFILRFTLGYGSLTIARALENVFGEVTRFDVADILKGLGYGAETVGRALEDVYDASDRAVAGVLKRAGYTAEQIVDAVRDIFGTSKSTIESWGGEFGDFFDDILDSWPW